MDEKHATLEIRDLVNNVPQGWVLESYEDPMSDKLPAILEQIRSILLQGKVQTLTLEVGRPIKYTKMVKSEEASNRRRQDQEDSVSLGAVARNVLMDEYTGKETEPSRIFIDMLLQVEARKLYLTHIGVGSQTRLFKWLGLDPVAWEAIENLSVPLIRDAALPDENLIFFAGPQRGTRTDKINYAVKTYMFLAEDLHE